MRQRLKAFTLIELMVVIVIIGILLGILFTGWGYISEQQAIKKAKLEIVGLKNAVNEFYSDYGSYPWCDYKTCTQNETLFLALVGLESIHEGQIDKIDLPRIPSNLFSFDLSKFNEETIPNLSHDDTQSFQLWLAQTLGKDPAFLDPWGNEYVYEFPLEDGGPGYRLFSMGPDGKTGEEYSEDDIK
jgi:prepilin-type N-terminal cleavage/methylation domain-containing protein